VNAGLWLAGRELSRRATSVLLAVALVGFNVALSSGLELVFRAREEAVASRIDQIAPPLSVVPPGVSASAAGRLELGPELLPEHTEAQVRSVLGSELRMLEARLAVSSEVSGAKATLVGVSSQPFSPGQVTLGSLLSERLGASAGHFVVIENERYLVAAVNESTASIEDAAAFVPLALAQKLGGVAGVNQLRLYLWAGGSVQSALERLRAAGLTASVLRTDRGAVAEHQMVTPLARYRRLFWLWTAAVTALVLLVAAFRDASSRRAEFATLLAIGAPRAVVAVSVMARSLCIALAGGALGLVGGGAIAALQGDQSWAIAAILPVLGVGLAVPLAAGGAPSLGVAIWAAAQNPVRELQRD
jgi:hypothetical protein